MKRVGILISGALCVLGAAPAPQEVINEDKDRPILYLFLTPECRQAPEAVRQAKAFLLKNSGRIHLRPVLLVSDFSKLTRIKKGDPFQRAMKALRELGPLSIPLYDEEGLRLAKAWRVKAVPAFVLVAHGKAHRGLGAHLDLEALWRCGK